jgi:hypothetical protein
LEELAVKARADHHTHGAVLALDRHDAAFGERELGDVLDDLGLRRDRVDAAGRTARFAVGLSGGAQRVAGGVVSGDDLDGHRELPTADS